MDPLVRSVLWVQRQVARATGTGLAVLFGGALVYTTLEPVPPSQGFVAFGLLLASTAYRAWQRLRRQPAEDDTARLDLELFSHLVIVAYAVVLHAPDGLDGPAYPVVYALGMLAASFARPRAAGATVTFAVLLESAIHYIALAERSADRLFSHAALLGVFTILNFVVSRAEITRIRKLSRLRIETELRKMRESARTYRLLGAPSGQDRTLTPAPDDPERLLRSGVDEIHQAVEFALSILRRTRSRAWPRPSGRATRAASGPLWWR